MIPVQNKNSSISFLKPLLLLRLSIIISILITGCKDDSSNSMKKAVPQTSEAENRKSTKIFERIDRKHSNINFSNTITPNISTLENLFDFDYFYNGAGVGLIDINNDGLLDIVFAGNQVSNRLYLNQGNFKFKDITETSGINIRKNWSNAVTIVDLNSDGWDDIYFCQGGPNNRLNRNNLLFINNQDGTFSEQAEEFGLADLGISTHSAFFDFDNDGDLDCFVMNENELYGVDPMSLKTMVASNEENKYFNSSHLYENTNGKFNDITKKSGLLNPIFGLGLVISDINLDGLLDIYVASDYYIPDALYENQGNGKFIDKIKQYTSQISYYGMGADIADINNDALQDIFVLDMASQDHYRSKTLMASMNTKQFDYLVNQSNYQLQYMFNSLQLNLGNKIFSNVAQITGTAKTDWSWSVLMNDYDLDADRDIFITNGYRKYALDNDIQALVRAERQKYRNNVPWEIKKSLYDKIPSEKLSNIVYENYRDLKFKNNSSEWGLDKPSYSNGSAVGDLDNDGDLDMVVNNIDEMAFIYKNNSVEQSRGHFINVKTIGNLSDDFPRVSIYHDKQIQFEEIKRVRGYRSSQSNIAHFGLGNAEAVDSVVVNWPDGEHISILNPKIDTLLVINKRNSDNKAKYASLKSRYKEINSNSIGLNYEHLENLYDDFETEILLPYKQSNSGPVIIKGDVNNDGSEDIYIGGASEQAGVLYIQKSNKFVLKKNPDFFADRNHEDVDALFFDIDNDDDLDLYVVSGGNEFEQHSKRYADRIYINDGRGKYSKMKYTSLSSHAYSGGSVISIDYDNDGDQDLIVGNRMLAKNYPKNAPSFLFENKNGKLENVTESAAPELSNFGIINDMVATDFDNDGWDDFIVVGEWTGINFFKNHQGVFRKQTNKKLDNLKGWWFSIEKTDLNKDGLIDYVVGNVGQNFKFKASEAKPLKVFAKDFDNNGINDIVLSTKYYNTEVPVRGRECSSQQMPFIEEKFPSFASFASASLEEIYGAKNLDEAHKRFVNDFSSVLLLNMGNGNYEIKSLPVDAQLFPILDIEPYDFNKDGFQDIIVSGNIFETEVETPRLDAISGQILISDGKSTYLPMSKQISGIYPNKNVKDTEIIHLNGTDYFIIVNNNDALMTYKLK